MLRRQETFRALKKPIEQTNAFRLLQPTNRLPMARSLIGKSFLKGISWPETEPYPIEDVRQDARGNYYVQIRQQAFPLVDIRVQAKSRNDSIIDLPSLGSTLVKAPRKCDRVRMSPAALTRIHHNWTREEIADEIWTSNQHR